MGSIVKAVCECGFKTEDMCLGGGMSNFTTVCSFPNYCKSCKSFFIANMFDEKIICVNCKSEETLPYNDKSLVKDLSRTSFGWNSDTKYGQLKLSEKNSFCPKCENYSLEFIRVGLWD